MMRCISNHKENILKRYENNSILVISDTHFPYHDRNTFQFLKDLNDSFHFDRVVHTGDLLDSYHASKWVKDPDHPHTAGKELELARKAVAELAELFPNMLVCIGNHDKRMEVAGTNAGLSRKLLRPISEVFGFPDGWRFREEHRITVEATRQQIVFRHWQGANALLNSQRAGANFIQGHAHGKCGVYFHSNGKESFFAVQMPVLISDTGCPFNYSKLMNINPVRGALIISDGNPILIRQPRNNWRKRGKLT